MAENDLPITIGKLSAALGVRPARIREAEARGILPPAQRLGPMRVWARAELPAIRKALRDAGFIRQPELAHA